MNEHTPRIAVEGVSKTFHDAAGHAAVIDRVDLFVGRHEFVSLLGPSGSGKSTLLRIVAGLEAQSRGTVSVDGAPARPGRTGLMPQRDLLMPWKRLVDNVALGAVVAGTPRPVANRLAAEMLQRFGLGEFAAHYPARLSGGMRQRAALARTFLAGGDVLLLDEPFGALDSLTRSRMHSLLLDVWEGTEASVLFVTHDIDEALLLSDRVYVITPPPSRVSGVVEVDLARPRTYETTLTEEFTVLKRQTLQHLHPPEPSP